MASNYITRLTANSLCIIPSTEYRRLMHITYLHIGPIVPGSGCFKLSGRIRVSKVHVRLRISLITVRIRVRLGLW